MKIYLDRGFYFSESSHFFIKTFFDVITDTALERNCRIDILVLRRYMPSMIQSIVRNNEALSNEEIDKYYYDSPNSISVTEKPTFEAEDINTGTIYYVIDIEAHVEMYKQLYGGYHNVRIHDVRQEALLYPEGLQQLADTLDLEWKPHADLNRICCTTINPKTGTRIQSREDVVDSIQKYLDIADEQNIFIPELPHMVPYESSYGPVTCTKFIKMDSFIRGKWI